MKLTFNRTARSINSFPTIELPDFSIITGLNGSGKSHLLTAIQGGDIAVDEIQDPGTSIRLFDYKTLVPQSPGYFNSETLRQEKITLYQQYQGVKTTQGVLNPIREVVRALSNEKELLADPIAVLVMSPEELASSFNLAADAARIMYERLKDAEAQAEIILDRNLGRDPVNQLDQVAISLNKSLLALTEDEIMAAQLSYGNAAVFQQSFARLFVSYRDLFLRNQMAQWRASKGSRDVRFISDEEFVKTHGRPPWEFVNQSLIDAGLDFSINSPDLDENTPYAPVLTKNRSNLTIPFSDLSSGEQILLSFAFCVYYASDRRQLAVYPKLILLDEVDAPLHPSMSKHLIQIIERTLVKEFGVKVIATTHSPSTVALAPDDAIYIMRKEKSGLEKTTKAQALNALTAGVPTISLSFDGRRQVFVESPADAKIYDALYTLLKGSLSSERSLEFMSTGIRSAAGREVNTGSEIVRQLVGYLSVAGNQSVFGLLDWDGKNVPDKRLFILAYQKRNGIENLLLDPLLVAALICRDCSNEKHQINIRPDVSWLDFCSFAPADLQGVVNAVCMRILRRPVTKGIHCSYSGGFSLEVEEEYLTIDDHALEARILGAFPFLKNICRAHAAPAGKIMLHMIESVLTDKPAFIPVEIIEAFRKMLDEPAHFEIPETAG